MIDRYTGEIVWQARSSTGNELIRESLRRSDRPEWCRDQWRNRIAIAMEVNNMLLPKMQLRTRRGVLSPSPATSRPGELSRDRSARPFSTVQPSPSLYPPCSVPKHGYAYLHLSSPPLAPLHSPKRPCFLIRSIFGKIPEPTDLESNEFANLCYVTPRP